MSSELMARTVRRADRAWVALAAVTAARESCEVSQWLQEEAVDQGYHVLCISEQEPIQLYVEGLQSQMLQLQGGKLVERLEEKLHIRRRLEFLEEGQSTVTQWPKQSWAVFTSEGERWRPEELDELVEGYRGVALLFEGGVWRWPPVRPGFRRSVLPGVVLETVATRPALFSLDLAPESGTADASASRLLRHAAATAERRLFRSETESQVSEERTSDQAWLSYGSTPELRELKDFTARVLRIPATYFEEKLQVLRYQKGQYYDAHRDYWDPAEFPYEDRFLHANSQTWLMRHATFFWYLQRPEKGGETWFPRAHGGPIPWDEWTACDSRGVKMGKDHVAILFYSLYSSGDVDDYSWHCGCPVENGTKWAANSWVWNQPFEPPFAQRMPPHPAELGDAEL